MTNLHDLLAPHVADGTLPGAVAVVARGDEVAVATVSGAERVARDTIFRLASLTKPVMAAVVLALVEDGVFALSDPVDRWLPELAAPVVVRTPASEVDDVVPAKRPITVRDLLTSQAGWGFPADFSLPAVRALFPAVGDPRDPQAVPEQDAWLAGLAAVPLLYQPGEAWLYDTCSALQGALVTRATGQSLPDVFAERVCTPLGMVDTGFAVPAADRDRFTSCYRQGRVVDGPDGQWSTLPAFPLGSAGLVGTVDDWLAFGRMLLAGGLAGDGRRVLSAASVRLMTTDTTTPAHRAIGALFLEGQGWGMGGSVDVAPVEPWHVPGRYGWVGGTGTSAHVVPATGTVALLFTQASAEDPVPPAWLREFWRYAAG